ncbi:MAG TPA: aminotransferase class V-fold PLP-dependent enzyme, partial [Candidatus Acidoferrales bacterium]|nr:aminotransferase class V-fold PLP-dependent enzyme [Candidatus Acidoferrales bacterium]
LPYFSDVYGNASSIHSPGQQARLAVEEARESVARLIGAKPAEIVFTSCGTEADNLAIFGIAAGASHKRHVITTAIEHHAVLHACEKLQSGGVDVSFVPVGSDGIVNPGDVRRALRPETVLISVMHANNELGTIQPALQIAEIAREADIYFHTDAVQSAGKLPIDVNQLGVDLLSLSAHKIYGPKGTGALYVRTGTKLQPIQFGGHHERDRRPGTENVAGIVGLGRAADIAARSLSFDGPRIGALRDHLENSLLSAVSQCHVNGSRTSRVSNTSNMTFSFAEGESLVIGLDLRGIACSTGAACSSGAVEPSHVLRAIGLPAEAGRSSVRFSLGRGTTAAEIDYAIATIPQVVANLRELSPAYGKTATLR